MANLIRPHQLAHLPTAGLVLPTHTEHILPANLRSLRRQLRLSQSQLAALLRITRSSLGAYEEGRAEPSYKLLVQLARLCGLTLDEVAGNV